MTDKTEQIDYRATYICCDCGDEFRGDSKSRRDYCDKCRLRRSDEARVKGGKGGRGRKKAN
ncbi:MAG: hypothetical protein JRD89_21010 [Deltaproteobacteria bacterium]|nr:hypothetical protein [Deltaproteobacteria bacterium]